MRFDIFLCTYYRYLRSYSRQIGVLHWHLIPMFVISMFVITIFVISMFMTVQSSYEHRDTVVIFLSQPPMPWVPTGRNRGRRFNHWHLSNAKVKDCLELYIHSITRLYVVIRNWTERQLCIAFVPYCTWRTGHRWRYGACALYAG